MVTDKEKSIFLGDSKVTLIEILDLISRGYPYESILRAYPDLTYGDIMAAAGMAAKLISEHLVVDDRVRVGVQVRLVVANRRLVNLEKIQEQYPRAYEPWTENEQQQLTSMYQAGESKTTIANSLGRRVGAVDARLERLGLVQGKGLAANE
ncbi:MAG: DUF433 domain-containing protein [bacterium]|nr:DUF433 domain-containing protein [bacterium]